MPKYIFVTGGVVSSLGKGITAASIGVLLKSRGLRIVHQKFDPYLNVDPGTMNPYQHGEVYVTDDGAETDLDLGHYERFTGVTTNKNCNYTTGRIYDAIIKKERRGDYLGGTVQVVPHVTTEICNSIRSVASAEVDVVICEIGGTVGDIESLPFLEALRQFRLQEGRNNVLFIHVTLIPYLKMAGEIKTKPTQHSVGKLREIGIMPDMLICRTEKHIDKDSRKKISLFCNVDEEAVIEAFDAPHSIYEVPLDFAAQDIDQVIIDILGLRAGRRNLKAWRDYVDRVINAADGLTFALIARSRPPLNVQNREIFVARVLSIQRCQDVYFREVFHRTCCAPDFTAVGIRHGTFVRPRSRTRAALNQKLWILISPHSTSAKYSDAVVVLIIICGRFLQVPPAFDDGRPVV